MIDLPYLVQQCAPTVAPSTMMKIIKHESGKNPYAIGYLIQKHGKIFKLTTQPKGRAEAITWARWLLNNGFRFDAGIAQINSSNFQNLNLNAETVFDACTNIAASGKLLTNAYRNAKKKYGDEQTALLAAISEYQSGNYRVGFQTGYVQKVVFTSVNFSSSGDLMLKPGR